MTPVFDILDHRRFRPLLMANAQLERLHTGMRWAEGPAWFPDMQALLVSDIPNDRILITRGAEGP
jgi:gluconolactonase